jgi:cysteinyl-tRNA synthetase
VRSFEGYGKLSKRKLDDLQAGARIETSDEKRDPFDLALWKGCAEDEWGWESPWGKGRPGWHIECSAMSSTYLGHGFDVHCGGMDLIFPHHENEIAQSEAAHPGEGDFVGTWIHNGFVNVDKEKMAKSLGNFVTVADVYERYDPEALRYFLMTVQYRGPIAFETDKREDGRVVFPGIAEAERRVDYLYATVERLAELAVDADGELDRNKLPKELKEPLASFEGAAARLAAALDDDLSTPAALAVLADLTKHANELGDLAQRRRKDARFVAASKQVAAIAQSSLRGALDVLGLVQSEPGAYQQRTTAQRLAALGIEPAAIEAKIDQRVEARKNKDFSRADGLRDELAALGIELADSPDGTTWRVGVQ